MFPLNIIQIWDKYYGSVYQVHLESISGPPLSTLGPPKKVQQSWEKLSKVEQHSAKLSNAEQSWEKLSNAEQSWANLSKAKSPFLGPLLMGPFLPQITFSYSR